VLSAESAPTSTRMLAITTGMLGLVAVGLLVMVMTPPSADAPVALDATTTPRSDREWHVGAVLTTLTGPPQSLRGPDRPLATPIGDGRYAIVTAAGGPMPVGDEIEVRLPSGDRAAAEVTADGGDTLLVELLRPEPGVELATARPTGRDIVTVLVDPPVTIPLDDLDRLDAEEGTAVLDRDGRLVGLCSRGGDGVRLLEVSDELADATNGG
jgi:hypothetical protein